jgi:hypothetical protein
MTPEQASRVEIGDFVTYRGDRRQVTAIVVWGPDAPLFSLSGLPDPISYQEVGFTGTAGPPQRGSGDGESGGATGDPGEGLPGLQSAILRQANEPGLL